MPSNISNRAQGETMQYTTTWGYIKIRQEKWLIIEWTPSCRHVCNLNSAQQKNKRWESFFIDVKGVIFFCSRLIFSTLKMSERILRYLKVTYKTYWSGWARIVGFNPNSQCQRQPEEFFVKSILFYLPLDWESAWFLNLIQLRFFSSQKTVMLH